MESIGFDYYGSMSLKSPTVRCKRVLGLLAALASSWAAAQTAVDNGPENSVLDGEIFYEVLVGEISAQAGDGSAAFALLLDAARKANAANLFERAVQIALDARNGDAALQAAQSWVRAYPQALDANRYFVQILVGLNRPMDAVAPLKRAMRAMTAADKFATIEALPRYFARATDRRLAATSVEQVLVTEVSDPVAGPLAWAVIGQMRLQANDAAGALGAAKRGIALNPQSAAPATLALALLGTAAPEAESLVQSYLAGKPSAEFRVAYIRYLVGAQRIGHAYAQALKLTQQSPDYADGWLLQGSIELQEGKFQEAEATLKKYMEIRAAAAQKPDPQAMDRSLVMAHVLLSQVAEQGGRYDEALVYLQRIGNPAEAMRMGSRQAAILAKQGKLEEGLALLRALPEPENQPDAAKTKAIAVAQLLRDNKKPLEAYQTLEAALARFPDDLDMRYDLAMMAEKMGKLDVMEELMRQVIAAKPDFHAAYNALGYSLADRNIRLGEARQLIAKALEFAPGDPFIVDSMAWLEYRSGNTQEAIRLLQSAFKARPDAEIAAHLGEVLWSAGEKSQAAAIWEQGLKINPENETLLETTQRLRNKP
ncbi:MAG: hypothetical protein CFE43_19065 [Burkholderiales bacterium PBB3]|nr:MAG: hypothetical protein CFE43_19065 [Burkholderiales bacterium PBB3]